MSQRLPEVKFHSYTVLDGSEQVLVQKVGDGSIMKRFDKRPIPQRLTDVVCPHFLELKWAYGCHARAENQPRKSTNLHLGNGSLGDTLL